jgi:hypothetical protein
VVLVAAVAQVMAEAHRAMVVLALLDRVLLVATGQVVLLLLHQI